LAGHVVRDAHSNGFVGYAPEYVAGAALFMLKNSSPRHNDAALMSAAVGFLLTSEPPFHFERAARVIEWAMEHSGCDRTLVEKWVATACENSPHPDEIQAISRILEALGDEPQARVAPALTAATVEYIANNAHHEFDASDVFGGARPNDLQSAWEAIETLARQKLEEYGAEPNADSIRAIVEAYDVDSQADTYFADCDSGDDWREFPRAESTDQIDDLFERT
jgi:hypothetical protein